MINTDKIKKAIANAMTINGSYHILKTEQSTNDILNIFKISS
ncbi:hypothetical protein [Clostridium lundense]|nr:hypothetical protein [Clostridium lundense]